MANNSANSDNLGSGPEGDSLSKFLRIMFVGFFDNIIRCLRVIILFYKSLLVPGVTGKLNISVSGFFNRCLTPISYMLLAFRL